MQLAEWKWSKCYLQKPNILAAHGMDKAKLDDNTLGQESKGQAFQRGKKWGHNEAFLQSHAVEMLMVPRAATG